MKNEDIEEQLKEMGIEKYHYNSLLFRFFDKYCPWILNFGYAIFARFSLQEISALHKELNKSKTIDIFPTSGNRGFILAIDRKKSFFFYQDGDHFSYDGCEIGEYEKGDVTIFDDISKEY